MLTIPYYKDNQLIKYLDFEVSYQVIEAQNKGDYFYPGDEDKIEIGEITYYSEVQNWDTVIHWDLLPTNFMIIPKKSFIRSLYRLLPILLQALWKWSGKRK